MYDDYYLPVEVWLIAMRLTSTDMLASPSLKTVT